MATVEIINGIECIVCISQEEAVAQARLHHDIPCVIVIDGYVTYWVLGYDKDIHMSRGRFDSVFPGRQGDERVK